MRKLLLLAFPLALVPFACSSSDGEDTPTTEDGGGPGTDPGVDSGTPIDKDSGGGGGDKDSSVPPEDACKDPVKGVAAPKLLLDPTDFIDGPVYVPAAKALVFSNFNGQVLAQTPIDTGSGALFSPPSPGTLALKPIGNALSADGKTVYTTGVVNDGNGGLFATTNLDKTPASAAYAVTGETLFSPNDIAVHSKGMVYVTDPAYQKDFSGGTSVTGIYRIGADKKVVIVEQFAAKFEKPNGIDLSPDEKFLYVGMTDVKKIRRYSVDAAGIPSKGADWATVEGDNPDGLAVDSGGNVWVTTSKGVEVFKPDASKAGILAVPSTKNGPANAVTFGGADKKTLVVTTGTDGVGGIWTTKATCAGK